MIRKISILLALLVSAVLLAACGNVGEERAEFRTLSTTVDLEPDWAKRGGTVTVTLTGANAHGAEVAIDGEQAEVTVNSGHEFEFEVPQQVAAGTRQVTVALSSQTLLSNLYVLGDDVVSNEFVLVVAPGTSEEDLADAFDGLDYTVTDGPRPLGGDAEICSGELVRVEVAGMATGEALDELNHRAQGGTIWYADPQSGYSSGALDHQLAVGADLSRLRGADGTGTLIAVIDTGVSNHLELGSRLLLEEGYDFVDPGTPATDSYGEAGHGTPIAVLSAGSVAGVAPQANVLPVRVCDDEGICYSSDVLVGICYALDVAQRRGTGSHNTILNLSLGGETPVPSVRDALEYAVSKGALVAASGGNRGAEGSPAHYPAAHDLDGVLAVAALEESSTLGGLLGDWEPAAFSTRGGYLDISAPGVDLTSGTSSGGYASNFTGTSYATALVTGALAAWREVHPELSPAQIEARIEEAARPLPYAHDRVGAGMLDLSSEPR